MEKNGVLRAAVAALAAWALAGLAGATGAAEADLHKAVADQVARFRADAGAKVALHVLRLADGATLCQISAAEPMIPASNQKLLTSAVALKRLGANFQFRTVLATVGGTLAVYGDGDPTTGDARLSAARNETIYAAFDRWAAAAKAAGINKADNLIVHAGIFQPPVHHPDWPKGQTGHWYGAPVAGANFNDNCLDVGFQVKGVQVAPVISPLSRFLIVDSKVSSGKKQLWSCRFNPAGTHLTLTGTVAVSTTAPLSVAVPDPAMLFACVLGDRFAQAGIDLGGNVHATNAPADARGPDRQARVIAADWTPLSAVLARCNKNSLNMMAECLFLRSAVEDGAPATWEKAAQVAGKVLTRDYGVDAKEFVAADGSGLSKANRASPGVITALLRALAGEPVFVKSLSVSGVDGSLDDRLDSPAAKGRVLGKTGSLAGASALSGYVTDGRGVPALAFSILVNGPTYGKTSSARGMEDAVCEILIRAVDSASTRSAPAQGK